MKITLKEFDGFSRKSSIHFDDGTPPVLLDGYYGDYDWYRLREAIKAKLLERERNTLIPARRHDRFKGFRA